MEEPRVQHSADEVQQLCCIMSQDRLFPCSLRVPAPHHALAGKIILSAPLLFASVKAIALLTALPRNPMMSNCSLKIQDFAIGVSRHDTDDIW